LCVGMGVSGGAAAASSLLDHDRDRDCARDRDCDRDRNSNRHFVHRVSDRVES